MRRLATVRIRVTIGAVVVVAIALTAGGAWLVRAQRQDLTADIETTARLRSRDVAATVADGELTGRLAVPRGDENLVQVVDANGTIVAASTNVGTEFRISHLNPGRDGYAVGTINHLPEGDVPFRVVARRVQTKNANYTVYVAGSLEPVEHSTDSLIRLLFIGLPILLFLVGATTWVVIARALHPVEAIRAEVEAIGAEDLARRVPEPRTADEIARLAHTMNAMLARLDLATDRQSRFVADASHELRGPLTGIRTQLEVDLAHPERADWQATDREVLDDTVRLQRLVDDLLALARADAAGLGTVTPGAGRSRRDRVERGAPAAGEDGASRRHDESVGRAARRKPGRARAGGAEPVRQRGATRGVRRSPSRSTRRTGDQADRRRRRAGSARRATRADLRALHRDSTTRGLATRAAPAWASPSPTTSSLRTVGPSLWRARPEHDSSSCSPCRTVASAWVQPFARTLPCVGHATARRASQQFTERQRAAHSWIAPTALIATAVALACVLGYGPNLPVEIHVLLVLGACAGYVGMNAAHRRWGGLSIRLVALAVAGYCAVAVLEPPRETGDLFWYAIYGRIVAVYHSSPYTRVPASFPHDPLLRITGHGWAHVPSVYGPLFTGLSAAASTMLGTAEVPTRVFYQLLATAALLAACVLVWRRTRSAGAVAFLAVNPAVAIYLVNGGRNDILVGLAMLGALVLSYRGRDTAAGVVGGLGALVKLTGVVGVVALIVSTSALRGRRPARRIGVAAVTVVGSGYLLAGPTALFTPMRTAGAAYSKASVWQAFPMLGSHFPSTHVAIALLALPCLLVILACANDPVACVTGGLTALTLGAAYMLPGYAGWAVPSASLDPTSRISRIAAAEGVVLVAAYEVFRHPFGGPIGDALTAIATIGAPLAVLALLVLLLADGVRRRPSRRVATEGGLSVRRFDGGDDLIGPRKLTA